MKVRGSVVIVTGASSGIGAVTARVLAGLGAVVVLAARREERVRALADEIERAGGRALAVRADVMVLADIERLVAITLETFGRIDVLVNNAGVGGGSTMRDDDEAMQAAVATNLLAPARLTRAVAAHMGRQGGGVIVNIGSVAGEVGVSALYSGTKFGLRGLNDAMRRELRPQAIAVVLIEPGVIRGEMTAGMHLLTPGPEVVARAIAGAIERPRRKIIVPRFYEPLIWLAKLAPGLVDRVLGNRLAQQAYHRVPNRPDGRST